jgi:two-component system, chemotaxis family, chemotaxis protein CheY
MEFVRVSAEHHFLNTLETLSGNPEGWFCLYFCFSKTLSHKNVVSDKSLIMGRLKELQEKAENFSGEFQKHYADGLSGYSYIFADQDVVLLCHAPSDEEKLRVREIFQLLSAKLPKGFSDLSALKGSLSSQHTLADKKMLSAKLQSSYACMADKHKVSSIAARRKRRDAPLVMVVEDDRFTAHYASTIISKEFNLVMCRNAEEAIEAYIENAPDIVFMDIHLPGLSGHDALEAIYAVDPEAFVVMLSVDTVKDNVVKASQNGARKFLKKPFTRDRILETVKNSPYVRAHLRSTSTGHDTLMN